MNELNITNDQKELLRKLVKLGRQGKLGKPITIYESDDFYSIIVKDTPFENYIHLEWLGDLDMLCDANLIKKHAEKQYSITQKGYDAVDQKFINHSQQIQRIEFFIEDIDSFSRAKNIRSQDVKALVPLNLSEDRVQTFFEEIIGENFHQQDWGGELNDLVTSHLTINGQRLRAAFLLKGNGTRGKLTIRKCGKNGDQILRLVEAPVDLYVVQHVDEIDQRVIYDLQSKVELKLHQGFKCQFCILDGTETARILKAYGKL